MLVEIELRDREAGCRRRCAPPCENQPSTVMLMNKAENTATTTAGAAAHQPEQYHQPDMQARAGRSPRRRPTPELDQPSHDDDAEDEDEDQIDVEQCQHVVAAERGRPGHRHVGGGDREQHDDREPGSQLVAEPDAARPFGQRFAAARAETLKQVGHLSDRSGGVGVAGTRTAPSLRVPAMRAFYANGGP